MDQSQEASGVPEMETRSVEQVALDRLVRAIEAHLEHHRRLLEAMERKKQACIEVALDGIEAAVEDERRAIDAIALSERERIAAADDVAAAIGFEGRPRLLDLIQRVGEEHREVLLDLRDELRKVADGVERLNRLNRTLVLHSLEHVNLFLVLLAGGDLEENTYSRGKSGEGTSGPILLDRRI